jgi:GNAT superfamily N-acetyltransferase
MPVAARLVPFAPAHAAEVVAVIRRVFAEYGMTFELAGFDADLQDVAAHYQDGGGMFSVLLEGDRVVGTVGAVPREEGDAEVKRLYLLSEHRGRGHGRRLLEHVIDWARARGHRRVVAWSDVRLETAHQVYLRVGFVPFGERQTDDIDRSREYGFVLDL